MRSIFRIVSDSIGYFLLIWLFVGDTALAQTDKTREIPGGRVGTTYSLILPAKGGIPPYTWTIIGGTLPPGLTLSNEGELSGTFTNAGSYGFTVQVLDSQGEKTSAQVKIQVEPRLVGITPLKLKTYSLPNAIESKPYQLTFAAEGGLLPYEWTVVGELPEGLQLNPQTGELSGTPRKTGTSRFTLKVKDAQGTPAIAEQQMTLTVDISAIGAGDIAFFKPLLILTGLGMWLLLAIIIASIVGLMVILRAPDVGTSQDKSTAFVLGIVLIILGVVGYFISNLAYDKWGEKQWFLWLAVTLAISGAVGLLFLMNQLVTMWKGYRPGIIAKGTETFR